MVRASHLTEIIKVLYSIRVLLFVATVALNCSSLVDHGEDSIRYEGNVNEILKPHSPSIFTSWVAAEVSSSCLIRSSIASNIFSGELKRPTTPYTYIVNCRDFHD